MGLFSQLLGNITPRVNPAYPTAYQGGGTPIAPANIPDHSITYQKVQEVSANTVLGQGNTSGTVIEIPFTQAARTFSAAEDQAAQRSVLGIPPGTIVSNVNVTSTSLTVTGSPLPSASNTITVNLPSIANLSVLGVGSGGNTTAKPILLVAGNNITLTPASGNITIASTGGGGTGNVSGPGSSGNGTAALFNGTTGQLIEDSKVFITIPAGNATLTIDSGFTLHATANTTVSGTNTGDQSAANPTATASDTAVNGSASTFMRSDAAPAVQKGSSSAFGIVKVDGTTITASAGVISAVGGSGNVTGPGSSTNLALATWSGTGGTALLDNPNATLTGNTSQYLDRSGNFSVPPGTGGSGSVYPNFTTPVDGNYAWVNQGSATVTVNANGGIFLFGPKGSGVSFHIRKLAIPTTGGNPYPYTLTAAFFTNFVNQDFQDGGLVVRKSGTGEFILFGFRRSSTGTQYVIQKYNSATSFNGTVLALGAIPVAGVQYLRIQDNSTNRLYSYSSDGYNFTQIASETHATFIQPDEAGFGVDEQTNTYDMGITLLSWSLTTP